MPRARTHPDTDTQTPRHIDTHVGPGSAIFVDNEIFEERHQTHRHPDTQTHVDTHTHTDTHVGPGGAILV